MLVSVSHWLRQFPWIRAQDQRRNPVPLRSRSIVRAKYDAAQTTDNNRRHWSSADGLSANTANSPQVRRILRNRTRYEVANNSYARGIVLTLANDSIGTGPRLQMLTDDRETNNLIEKSFSRWAYAVRLPEKLRTLRMAKAEDGEGFAILANNPKLDDPVKLDLKLVEADQVATPLLNFSLTNAVDGIVLDEFGNPTEYHVLKQHPGDLRSRFWFGYDKIPAEAVLHYYRVDRPGQARGIPELTPALPLFAMLREYTLATLDAAKAAAYFAGILYTDAPPNGESDSVDSMDTIELERNMLLTMPGGWKMSQVDAKQPASTYADFKHEILNEIARCLNMPFNVAAGNSSGYNYASGRLDHQVYFKSIRVEQSYLASHLLDPVFQAWLKEAARTEGLFSEEVRKQKKIELPHQWFFDGHELIDPLKESAAQSTRLQNHTTTLAEEYAKRGRDWEAELRQRSKEIALMRELGLPSSELLPATTPPSTPPARNQEEDQYAPIPESDD